MKTDKLFSFKNVPSPGLCNAHVSSFLTYLRSERYAEKTLRTKQLIITSFVQWTMVKQLPANDLKEFHLTQFVERSPGRKKAQVNLELAALRPFFRYLRTQNEIQPSSPIATTPVDDLEHRYTHYLLGERGLAENSIRVYLPFIHDFLTDRVAKVGDYTFLEILDAQTVQDFLLDRVHDRSSEYSRLLATSLRSFLRFLYLRGETQIDLSLCVPTVRRWSQTQPHTLLSPEEVERILSAVDRSTPKGRRDYAILLLLARLGLRAGEIVFMELKDILWRTGEIVVRGKGKKRDHLPLPSEVGEAVALYLCQDRGTSRSRQVFLRNLAPRVGLAGPGAVGHIVRYTLARAGLNTPCGSAAHLFRHSLATKMIRNGASITEISEILRHRCRKSTETYAKVDFRSLREVARPWPVKGGAR